jgi:hypothetical protein
MTEHEVLVSRAAISATCSCGWASATADDHFVKLCQSDAHMHEHYGVFVESEEDDGTVVMCWGVPR